MARRPYFSGNYGSALGSTANAANLLARAGETQGKMFANMGAQVGGMIQQYGLNKEKQKENKATIKSSIGILQRMSKIDETNAPQYMAQIQQLENEDVPLSQRGMLADKTLQGLSITNQLQSQMLSNQGKQQALGLAKQLEASTVKNAELKNTNLGFRNDLAELAKRKGEAVTPAEIRSILSRYSAEKDLLPGETAAKKATNELTTEAAQASRGLLPLQTSDKKGELAARSREREILDEVVDQSGGIKGMARKQVEATDLKTEATKQEIKSKQVLADYYRDVGLAKKLEAVGKLNPSLKQQLDPLTKMQSDLLSTKVAVPGEGQTRIPLSEYLELNKEDDTKYPLNGIAGKLFGILQNTDKQMEGVLSDELVDVYVPDEVTNQPTEPSASVVPAYQQAINRAKGNTQKEYMNAENVGGAGFPFMP
jgi:hypothetical protein